MSPYYPPSGGGGGSGTPGGSDSQVQVNSQNTFAGFPNLRWIGSSNSLDLNTAGRIRHGGVAEVDGVAPTGVTGLIWLDTSASSFTSSSAGLAGTGPFYVLQSGNSTLPNSKVLTAGSSVTVRTDATAIYIDAKTGGGVSSTQNPDFTGAYPISNLNWERIYIIGLTAGTTDFYTCASGNRVILSSIYFANSGNKTMVAQVLIKINGTYYYPNGGFTIGPGGSSVNSLAPFILEGGNSISLLISSNNGASPLLGAFKIDTSSNLKSVVLTSFNSGFNVLYTAPMTGNSVIVVNPVNPPSGTIGNGIYVMNTSGTTRSIGVSIVPSGQTASSAYAVANTANLGNGSRTVFLINASLNSGDTIQISSDVNTTGLFSWVNVYETP